MRHFVSVDSEGFVVSASSMEVVNDDFLGRHIEVPYSPDLMHPRMWAYVNGSLVDLGNPPSPAHKMDRSKKRWVIDTDMAWAAVRSERDRRMAETDWVVTKAQETKSAVSQAYLSYRQALRDITKQPDPTNIKWPAKP